MRSMSRRSRSTALTHQCSPSASPRGLMQPCMITAIPAAAVDCTEAADVISLKTPQGEAWHVERTNLFVVLARGQSGVDGARESAARHYQSAGQQQRFVQDLVSGAGGCIHRLGGSKQVARDRQLCSVADIALWMPGRDVPCPGTR